MARLRHLLLSFLAVVALCSALSMASASVACPMEPQASTPMPHHDDGCGQRAPVSYALQPCALCLGVLPSLAVLEPHAPPRFVPAMVLIRPLSGVDPALDPPPPRAA